MENGFLYVAIGEKYIREAEISAQSLKNHMPQAKISLVTTNSWSSNLFDNVIVAEVSQTGDISWKSGLSFKTLGLDYTPYQKTIFIDTDTFFTDNCEELFDILDYFDMTMCQAPNDTSILKIDDKKIKGYYPYNTGVIGYNKSQQVSDFFKKWADLYAAKQESYIGDQPAFMEALLYHNLKIYVLQPIYNFRLQLFVSLPPLKVKILHGRTNNFPRIDKTVNAKLTHRVWSPYYQRINVRYRRFKGLKKQLNTFLGKKNYLKLKSIVKKYTSAI